MPDPPAANSPVIEVRGLRMAYDGFEAVKGIDLHVNRGEIFAFLGPNGAGKTTTVEILEGYRRRTGGDVRVLGTDPQHAPRSWRSRIGVVLQSSEVERELTVQECLELYAGYYPNPRPVHETLELVGLAKQADVRGAHLSGGQQRRVDVALGLIGDPELLFLDEPTTGFDPSARRSAWSMVAGLRELGKTIFLTTHYMDEAEYLADRIAVLAAGRIVAEGTPRALGGRDRQLTEIGFTLPTTVTPDQLPPELRDPAVGPHGAVTITTPTPMRALHVLSDWAVRAGHELPDIIVRRPSLEDIYLQLVGQGQRQGEAAPSSGGAGRPPAPPTPAPQAQHTGAAR